jgi:hypothetical protein
MFRSIKIAMLRRQLKNKKYDLLLQLHSVNKKLKELDELDKKNIEKDKLKG